MQKTIYEDPNRMMRAFRQSSELNLTIEDATLKAIYDNFHFLNVLVPESSVRLFNELFKMIKQPCKHLLMLMSQCSIQQVLGFSLTEQMIDRLYKQTNSMRIKVAILLEQVDEPIVQWCNKKQICATNHINKHDLNFFECIRLYLARLQCVISKYDMLKLIHDIDQQYYNHGYEYVRDMITYSDCNELQDMVDRCVGYPISINQLKLHTKLITGRWNIRGSNIKLLKDTLIDHIYKDEVSNNEMDLITFVGLMDTIRNDKVR